MKYVVQDCFLINRKKEDCYLKWSKNDIFCEFKRDMTSEHFVQAQLLRLTHYLTERSSKWWKAGISMKNKISLFLSFEFLIKGILICTVNRKINIRWIFSNSNFFVLENMQTFTHCFACHGAFPIAPFP